MMSPRWARGIASFSILGAVTCAALAACAGCDGLTRTGRPADQEPTEFSSIRLPGVSLEAARPAALAVIKERYRLDGTATTGTVLVSRPLEVTARADDERAGVREVLSGSSGRRRQIARIYLVERGSDVVVRSNVEVQRLDVVERGAFLPQHGADDRPANLPPDRHAGTQTLTEQDWVSVGRDRQQERSLLNAIAEQFE